jgi:hypothetical protein
MRMKCKHPLFPLLGLTWALFPSAAVVFANPSSNYALKYDAALPQARIVLIIPGFGQKITDPAFHMIANAYQAKGITPVLVAIDWNRLKPRSLADTAAQLSLEIRRDFPNAHVLLFGFSLGAVLAYKLSESIHPKHALLCSMSPVFEEDHKLQPFFLQQLLGLIFDYSSHPLTYNRHQEKGLIFLYADHESFLINPMILAQRRILFANQRITIVKNAGHQLNPAYLGEIKKQVLEIE